MLKNRFLLCCGSSSRSRHDGGFFNVFGFRGGLALLGGFLGLLYGFLHGFGFAGRVTVVVSDLTSVFTTFSPISTDRDTDLFMAGLGYRF
jgi:hypothetical protein